MRETLSAVLNVCIIGKNYRQTIAVAELKCGFGRLEYQVYIHCVSRHGSLQS